MTKPSLRQYAHRVDHESVLTMLAEGKSPDDIAASGLCTARHVQWVCTKFGVPCKPSRQRKERSVTRTIDVSCKECRKTFTAKSKARQFCSLLCGAVHRKRQGEPMFPATCSICNATFKRPQSSRRKTCSEKCAKDALTAWRIK